MSSHVTTGTGPFFRSEISDAPDVAYLYTGAEGPALHLHREAALRYLRDKSDGEAGRERAERELDRCRALLAQLVHGDPAAVAILGNTSDALHRLVASIAFRSGDNVVTTDLEFPSGVLSLLALRSRGVEVRVVPARHWVLEMDDVAAAVDGRTRAVVASHVSYLSGTRIEPRQVRELAHSVGAAFILDATQSLGVLQVRADDADAIVSSSYKWLLGPHGIGLVYLSRSALFSEIDGVGWRSVADLFGPDRFDHVKLRSDARRLELGYPSFPSAYLLAESMALLATVDSAELEGYALDLSGHLRDELAVKGFELLTPEPRIDRGTNISVQVEQAASVAARMLEAGVRVWGGDGRVRFSVHGFNTESEIDLALAALRGAI